MIILNIRSGLADIIHSWSDSWDYHIQKKVDFKFIWDKKRKNCEDFQYYFCGLEQLDIVNDGNFKIEKYTDDIIFNAKDIIDYKDR